MTIPTSPPQPAPFALPADFALEWPDPAMAMATWQQDRQHVPLPITPMSSWWAEVFARGFSKAMSTYQVPLAVQTARLNTYYYMAIGPNVPPDQMPEAEARAVPQLMEGIGTFWDRWENEWLPELQSGWEDWARRDLRAASDAELKAAAADMVAWYERCWTVHFELLVPAMLGTSQFQDLYAEIFPGGQKLAAYRLGQGFDNMSLRAGRALWTISRVIKSDPDLLRLFLETPADRIWDALEGSAEGRGVRERLVEFLGEFGRRSDTVQELRDPSWIENPAPALENLKAYIAQDTDPDDVLAQLAVERERLVAEARAAVAGRPAEFIGMFEALLAAAQRFGRAQEDHNYWIDQRSLHEVRHLCLEIGRRLAERGVIAKPGDVLCLTMDEALDGLAGGDFAATVAAREAEMERWAQVSAPQFVGTDYGPPPDNPITRAIARFFGEPPASPAASNELPGIPGAPGKATGTARVIVSIADAGRLEPGDILVTPTTSPPWTPFFATAAAIVTDTGGPLSHCAIVAREYGIPAVVGAIGASATIKDGTRLEVDGDEGVVRLLS